MQVKSAAGRTRGRGGTNECDTIPSAATHPVMNRFNLSEKCFLCCSDALTLRHPGLFTYRKDGYPRLVVSRTDEPCTCEQRSADLSRFHSCSAKHAENIAQPRCGDANELSWQSPWEAVCKRASNTARSSAGSCDVAKPPPDARYLPNRTVLCAPLKPMQRHAGFHSKRRS